MSAHPMSLFAVLRLRPDNTRETLPTLPVMKRWWDYMADLMLVQPSLDSVSGELTSIVGQCIGYVGNS